MLSCIARVAKVCGYSNIKILIPKQMLQKLPIVFAQAGNTFENLLIKLDKLYILCIKQKKLLKKYITTY